MEQSLPDFSAQQWALFSGDSIDVLKRIPDNSVDSVVTDPPYGLSEHKQEDVIECMTAWITGKEYRPNKRGFMGRTWDSWVPGPEIWREVYRVLKPGGHVIAFAGTRTHDLMSIAIRLAGFENRDTIMWVYGSGFPKSMDVSKAIDKAAGVAGGYGEKKPNVHSSGNHVLHDGWKRPWQDDPEAVDKSGREYIPATESANQWQGWGTALKPAFEPALLFRKPLIGTVTANVLTHSTGALNIDGCRVEWSGEKPFSYPNGPGGCKSGEFHYQGRAEMPAEGSSHGRFPANLIHDGSDEVIALFPTSNGAGGSVPNVKVTGYGSGIGTGESEYIGGDRTKVESGSGSAARFFYSPKASKTDRNAGVDDTNSHPTVKPTDLMAYLVRLVTPPNGIVLDPFNGSGSTGKAAIREGMRYIGIDLDQNYIKISEERITHEYNNRGKVKKKTKVAPITVPVVQSINALTTLFED